MEELQLLGIMNGIDNIEIENYEDDNNIPIDNYDLLNEDDADDIGVIKNLNDDQEKLQQLVTIHNHLTAEGNLDNIQEILRVETQIQQYETSLNYLKVIFTEFCLKH